MRQLQKGLNSVLVSDSVLLSSWFLCTIKDSCVFLNIKKVKGVRFFPKLVIVNQFPRKILKDPSPGIECFLQCSLK